MMYIYTHTPKKHGLQSVTIAAPENSSQSLQIQGNLSYTSKVDQYLTNTAGRDQISYYTLLPSLAATSMHDACLHLFLCLDLEPHSNV